MADQKTDTELVDGILVALSRHGWNADRGSCLSVLALVLDDLRGANARVQIIHGITHECSRLDADLLESLNDAVDIGLM